MMIKVKEPLKEEYGFFHEGLILYTYLHLAADRELMDAMLASKVKGVAYETLIERDGSIPLLAPMSQIAGRLSIQEGCKISGEAVRWFRCSVKWCSGNSEGKGCYPRRRFCWNQCLQDRSRHGCRCNDHGYQSEETGIYWMIFLVHGSRRW